MTARRVFLAGAFGQGNPGDEALLAAFARGIGEHRAVVASSDPAATTAEHGLEAVARDDLARIARELRRADAVVIAGGTIFKALHPSAGRAPLALLRRTAALAAVTRALRKPLALVGVGAAPLGGASARGLARAIVRAADLLILRDEESATHLAAIGAATPIRVGADPAWILLPDPPERDEATAVMLRSAAGAHAEIPLDATTTAPPSPAADRVTGPSSGGDGLGGAARPSPGGDGLGGAARPSPGGDDLSGAAGARGDAAVVVALSHLAGDRDLAARLAAGLRPLVDAGTPVRLDPWQLDGDAELAADVSARLGDGALIGPPPTDLADARAGMTGARLVIAQRFHSLVAAASAGVPVLAVAHEPKLTGLARRLGQPTVAADAAPETFAAAVLDALSAAPASAGLVRRERDAAEDGFRLLRVLLARGRSDEAVDVEGLALRPEEWLG
jgi:polysaccharide pyruvyl transferase WcaK-like protein